MFEFPTDFGRYRLTGIAGEGGMATVYRAVLPGPMGFEKRCVVKVIRPALIEDEEFLRALVNEALLGCQLHHPNIVEVYEFNHFKGRYYLAMELVDGISMSYLIRRHRKVRAEIPLPVVLQLLTQMLEGLDYAHNAASDDGLPLNVVHRDLKPSNIAIAPTGMVKILDFGIARAAIHRDGMDTSGAIRGTPRYMSPEQIESPEKMTAASDLFSLGALVYELVTTRALFRPRPPQEPIDLVLDMPLAERIAAVEEKVPGLGGVFARLIARPLEQRYEQAAEVLADLQPLVDTHGDAPAAKAYLAMLVAEFKEEAAAEELVPDVEPPATGVGGPSPELPETEALPSAILSIDLGPDGQHATELAATIPLPPRPDDLISGRRQLLGPASGTGSTGTTATGREAQRPPAPVEGTSSFTPSTVSGVARPTPAPAPAEPKEGGGSAWTLVALLGVALVLLTVVLLTVGGGALMSWRPGGGGGPEPVGDGDGIRGGGEVVLEDAEPVDDPGDLERGAAVSAGGEAAIGGGAASGGTASASRPGRDPAGGAGTAPNRYAPPDDVERGTEPPLAVVEGPDGRGGDEGRGAAGAGDPSGAGGGARDGDPGEGAGGARGEPDSTQATGPGGGEGGRADGSPDPGATPTATGRLMVDSAPWATVRIDGASYGETMVNVEMPVGRHTVELRCMGEGTPILHTVTVVEDETAKFFKQFPDQICP